MIIIIAAHTAPTATPTATSTAPAAASPTASTAATTTSRRSSHYSMNPIWKLILASHWTKLLQIKRRWRRRRWRRWWWWWWQLKAGKTQTERGNWDLVFLATKILWTYFRMIPILKSDSINDKQRSPGRRVSPTTVDLQSKRQTAAAATGRKSWWRSRRATWSK